MSRVNLLPQEVMQRQRMRRLSYLIAGGSVALMALILLFYLVQIGRLGSVRDEIDQQERSNASIRADIQELQEFDDLRAEAQRKQQLLASAFEGEISFSGVLMDMSRLMPATAYLTDMSVQTTAGTAPAGPAAPTTGGFLGVINVGGVSLDFNVVADLLTRLEGVDGWENPWVQGAADAAGGGVTFTTGVDLSPEVLTDRGRGGDG